MGKFLSLVQENFHLGLKDTEQVRLVGQAAFAISFYSQIALQVYHMFQCVFVDNWLFVG